MFPSPFVGKVICLTDTKVAAWPHFSFKNLLTFKPFDAIISTSNETNERKYPNMTNHEALNAMDSYAAKIATKGMPTAERKEIYERMCDLYERFECVRDAWEWIADAARYAWKFVKKGVAMLGISIHPNIDWNGIEPIKVRKGEKIQQLYLIRLLDKDGDLIYSKVGTTTRSTQSRMKEHLRYYYDNGVRSIQVTRLWNCGNMDAEGLESQFRAHYIKSYPGTFKKNDRFINVEFDLEEADRIAASYLGQGN